MVLGTNALEDLGFYLVDRSGVKQMLKNLVNRYKGKIFSELTQSQRLWITQIMSQTVLCHNNQQVHHDQVVIICSKTTN